MSKLFICTVLLGLLSCSSSLRAEPARIAIVGDEPELVLLLGAELKEIALVERAELNAITSEVRLSGVTPRFQEAQEILFLERSGETVSVRLTETRSGGSVMAMTIPAAPDQELARFIAARLRPVVSSTANPSSPRIALLGFRFERDSPENRQSERQFNLKLASRLQSLGANVLERWRLQDLLFEKSVSRDESPFWAAATLVDGNLSQDASNLWKVRLRIRGKPTGEIVQAIEASSSEEAIGKIASFVLEGRFDLPESAAAEFTAFGEEAKWLMKQGLRREAWTAAETAIALGERGLDTATIRVKAAAMSVAPKFFEAQHERSNDWQALPSDQLDERVPLATQAMALLGSYLTDHPAKEPPQGPKWDFDHPTTLAVRSLKVGLLVLAASQVGPEAWSESHPELAGALREEVRKVARQLKAMPLGSKRAAFYAYLANFVGFWAVTADEAIEFYREVLDPRFELGETGWPELIRFELAFDPDPKPPILDRPNLHAPQMVSKAWRVPHPDLEENRTRWEGFLNELARSPVLLNQADSLSLRWHSTSESGREEMTRRIVDFISGNPKVLTDPRAYGIMCQFVTPLQECARKPALKDSYDKLFGAFLGLLRSDLPVSKGVITRFWFLFIDARNCDEKQSQEAFAAVNERADREREKPEMQKDLTSIRDQILRRYPDLARTGNDPGREVKQLWLAAEHQAALTAADLRAMVWSENALWALSPASGELYRINPQNGEVETLKVRGLPQGSPAWMMAWEERLVAAVNEQVFVSDPAKQEWRSILRARSSHAALVRNELWIVCSGDGESIEVYRISPELTETLVASSRRRPSVHYLDTVLSGRGEGIFPSAIECAVLLREVESSVLVYGTEGKAVRQMLAGRRAEVNGNLVILTDPAVGEDVRLVGVLRPAESGLDHPLSTSPGAGRFGFSPELDKMIATRFAGAWRDDGVDLIAWSARGSPNLGAKQAWMIRADASGTRITPLRFGWDSKLEQRVRQARQDANAAHFPDVGPGRLIATPFGWVILGENLAGFWFLPY